MKTDKSILPDKPSAVISGAVNLYLGGYRYPSDIVQAVFEGLKLSNNRDTQKIASLGWFEAGENFEALMQWGIEPTECAILCDALANMVTEDKETPELPDRYKDFGEWKRRVLAVADCLESEGY